MPKADLTIAGAATAEAARAWLEALRPPPRLTVSDWADSYRFLSAEDSAEPGKWRTDRAEYQRGWMDAVTDPAVEQVVVMKSAQVGWTASLGNILGYFVDYDPAPILVLMPTLDMGADWSKNRFMPMVRDTPALTAKMSNAARDGDNTIFHKLFPGGYMAISGANSPASLASRPIRIVLADEVDRYAVSAGEEGDPLSLAYKRTATFWNRKKLAGGTPTVAGHSRIEKLFEASDRRFFHVPCPHCAHEQRLVWGHVKWEPARPDTAAYACEACGALWTDNERWGAVSRGRWIASAPFAGTAGFHIWEAYSPWVRLADTVAGFLGAKDDPQRLKVWVNTALGEVWRERGEAPEWERLFERREDWGDALPAAAGFLTAFCDVQKDRLEVSVWAWGRAESWLVEHRVIAGDTSRDEIWAGLASLGLEEWDTADGRRLRIVRGGVDAGYNTQMVYGFTRANPLWIACDGRDGLMTALGTPKAVDIVQGGRKLRKAGRLWPVGVSLLKVEFYGNLRATRREDGDYSTGYVHLPTWADAEFCKQLVAEQMVTRRDGKREWQALRPRNEALDCRVGARAVALSLGCDRWGDAKWRALGIGERVALPPEPETAPAHAPRQEAWAAPERREPTPPGRDGWLGDNRGRGGGWL